MKLSQVKPIAEAVRSKLAPYCEECEIGGSVRRECPEIGDIEIVCIPKLYSA
jgi:DNA polymerase/3'-5' exonuclease PolX